VDTIRNLSKVEMTKGTYSLQSRCLTRRYAVVESLQALPDLERIDFVGELSGVDEAAQDVVIEVAKSKRDATKVF